MSAPEEARAAGVLFYDLPEALDLEQVDPLIRPAVAGINRSGWAWTAESCQGHPDATGPVWASNIRPMLRLVCRSEREGEMFSLLLQASRNMEEEAWKDALVPMRPVAVVIYPDGIRGRPDWCENLVYLEAITAFDRNCGIEMFTRFAALVCDQGRRMSPVSKSAP